MNFFSDRFETAIVQMHPYPHLVCPDFFSLDFCQRLLQEAPTFQEIVGGKNYRGCQKFHCRSKDTLNDDRFSILWKDLIKAGLSQPALSKPLEKFSTALELYYPQIAAQAKFLKAAQRGVLNEDKETALMDVQLTFHAPATVESQLERGPHLKLTNKLLIAHIFLRHQNDSTPGGDFVLFKLKPSHPLKTGPRQTVDPQSLDLAKAIPYEPGTLIMYLNSPASVQALTERAVSPFPLIYLNWHVELNQSLFSLP